MTKDRFTDDHLKICPQFGVPVATRSIGLHLNDIPNTVGCVLARTHSLTRINKRCVWQLVRASTHPTGGLRGMEPHGTRVRAGNSRSAAP